MRYANLPPSGQKSINVDWSEHAHADRHAERHLEMDKAYFQYVLLPSTFPAGRWWPTCWSRWTPGWRPRTGLRSPTATSERFWTSQPRWVQPSPPQPWDHTTHCWIHLTNCFLSEESISVTHTALWCAFCSVKTCMSKYNNHIVIVCYCVFIQCMGIVHVKQGC